MELNDKSVTERGKEILKYLDWAPHFIQYTDHRKKNCQRNLKITWTKSSASIRKEQRLKTN